MECNKFVEEKIGETPTPEFKAHLAGCPGCARDVEDLREVRSLYREASTEKYRGGVPKLRRLGLDSNGRRATASFRGARKLAYSAVGRGVRTCKDPPMPGYGVPPVKLVK